MKKAALTNLFGNGITRILGIRNLTWTDLKEFAGITQDQVTAIQYRKAGDKPPIQEPQKKNGGKPSEPVTYPSVTGAIESVEIKTGKGPKGPWTLYIVHTATEKYNTFSDTFGKLAQRSIDEHLNTVITWSETPKGKKLENIILEEPPAEEREPGQEG